MPRHYAWEDYFWPNTTVLTNKLGIVDEAELRDVEYDQLVDRQGEVERGEVQISHTFDGTPTRSGRVDQHGVCRVAHQPVAGCTECKNDAD